MIENKVDGVIKFPLTYLDVDKETTLTYKLTGFDPYDEA
jgi:hypothetical protein